MAHGTTPCASGITISQVNRVRMTAIHRGMVTLFRGLDSGIPDGLMGDAGHGGASRVAIQGEYYSRLQGTDLRSRYGPQNSARNIFGCSRAWPKTPSDFAFSRVRLTAVSENHLDRR